MEMRKVWFFWTLVIPLICSNGFAQSFNEENEEIECWRGGFRYVNSGDKIDNLTLSQMLDETAFSTYKKANCKYNVATGLWCATGVVAATSIAFLGMGVYSKATYKPDPFHPKTPPFPVFFAASGILAAASFVLAIPPTILTINSRRTLCCLAQTYNQSKSLSSLNVGYGGNCLIITLDF